MELVEVREANGRQVAVKHNAALHPEQESDVLCDLSTRLTTDRNRKIDGTPSDFVRDTSFLS